MSKSYRWTLLLAAIAFLAAACGGRSTSESGKTLVVGSVLSQTGPAAAYGSDADKGARLALETLTAEKLPFKVQYISQDDKSDKTEAAKVAQTLIDADHVNVILGPAISPSALSVGKLAEERRIPMVGTSPTLDDVTASSTYDRKYVFRVCFNDSFQGKALARFTAESLGKKSAAIIYDKTLPYSIGLAKTFREVFEQLGGKVKYEESYSVQDTDYSTLIDKVAAFDVDVLFIPGWDENVGPMLKQAGNRWDKFILLGGDAWPTHRLLDLAGGNIKNAYALSHFIPEDPSPEVQQFDAAYRKKYGELPSPFAALGHDAMVLIVDAAKRSASLDGPSLRDALASTKDLKAVTGTLSFDDKRNPQKEAVILKIYPDHFAFFKRVKP
jgi:branched-chain amino acid transport system substrate-binding protein